MEEALQRLDAFFNPRSVAVIGATKKVDKAGHVIFKNFATNKSVVSSKENYILLIQAKTQF